MQITVHFSAQARQAAGTATEVVALDSPAPVSELLRTVAERHASLQPIILTTNREPQPALLVFVNDAQVRPDAKDLLRDGDTVTILPPIAGG